MRGQKTMTEKAEVGVGEGGGGERWSRVLGRYSESEDELVRQLCARIF